jgi:hypothetical protein
MAIAGLTAAFEQLKILVAECEADCVKSGGGNVSAGVRLRSKMQDIKKQAQIIRDEIMKIRESPGTPS